MKDAREILRERARALRRPPPSAPLAGSSIEIVEFKLAKERFAIERMYVREVHTLRELTPLPCTPPFVIGMVNVRGQILPVIDVKKFFDLPESGITDLHVVIIVHTADAELGILADAIAEVRSIPLAGLQPSLPTLIGIRSDYLRGVTDENVVILDVSKILGDPKIIVNQEVEA